MTTNPTDPAFPTSAHNAPGTYQPVSMPGINMRNYFAGLAMQGLCANPVKFDAAMIAVGSIALADAMIATLNADRSESAPISQSVEEPQTPAQFVSGLAAIGAEKQRIGSAPIETDEQFVMRWVKFYGARKLEFDGSLWRAFENDMNIFITPTLSQLAELIRSYGFN